MAGNVGKSDVWIVAHPSVPVAEAEPGCLDSDHHAVLVGHRLRDLGHGDRALERCVNDSSHSISPHTVAGVGLRRWIRGAIASWISP